ncbi:hypothetical protein D9M70_273170 [compost metagenome]
MLEVGAVEAPRGEHHHAGVVQRAGALQGVEQQVRVVVDRRDALRGKQLGEQAHHHLAVLEHVADAARGAQVVLQHVVGAVAVAHQVDPGDVRVDVAVQVEALHRQLVALVGQHLLGGDDPGLDDALVVVEVGEEHVQRLDALDAALLDHAPFAGGDGAGNDVEGDQALGALVVAVEGEGDPRPVEQQVGFAAALGQQVVRGFFQPAGKFPVMRTALAVGGIHLVIEGTGHAELLVTQHSARRKARASESSPLNSISCTDISLWEHLFSARHDAAQQPAPYSTAADFDQAVTHGSRLDRQRFARRRVVEPFAAGRVAERRSGDALPRDRRKDVSQGRRVPAQISWASPSQ